MRIIKLSSVEVKAAIARLAAEKAGWGWHSDVQVKGTILNNGVTVELRDGHESTAIVAEGIK